MQSGETSCFVRVRNIFLVTCVLVLLGMLGLYASMGDFRVQVNPVYDSMLQAINVSRYSLFGYFGDVSNVTVSTNVTTSKLAALLVTGGGRAGTGLQKGDKEFPWMPDPCAKPRRQTGVEDLLCMTPPRFLPDYKNPCYQDGPTLRCLPYFHLIGICKSGTSDLFKRLYLHPDIVPNKGIFGKELWYWSWRRLDIRSPTHPKSPTQGMTLKAFTERFYSDQIRAVVDSKGYHPRITGHGDPMDIWDRQFDYQTPQNEPNAEELLWTTPYSVFHINPNVKLLLMLRDPVDRLYSHYFHSGAGTSAQGFHDHIVTSLDVWNKCLSGHSMRHCIYDNGIRKALRSPIYTSFYIVHLQEWLKIFPREQLLVFRNEDYAKDIKGTMSMIFKFLDVWIPENHSNEKDAATKDDDGVDKSSPNDALYSKMEALPQFYATKGKAKAGPMKPETRKLLVDLYRPFTEELARFLGDEKFAFKDKSFG